MIYKNLHPFVGSSMLREIGLSAVALYGNTNFHFYPIPAVRDRALTARLALHRYVPAISRKKIRQFK